VKKLACILTMVSLLAGCGWLGSGKDDRVVAPAETFPYAAPAASPAEPAPATSPGPPTTRAAEAATQPAAAGTVRPGNVVAATVLQVNDRFITLQQVLHPIRQKLRSAAGAASEDAFRSRAMGLIAEELRNQVRQTVLVAEAEKQMGEEETTAIAGEVQDRVRLAAAQAGSRAQFDEQLRQEGTDLATWKQDLRRALVVNLYLYRRLGSKVVVTRRTMWEYYRTHREEFRTAESVQMQMIAAPFKKFLPADRAPTEVDRQAAREQARQQIDRAGAALATGEDFTQVAKALGKGPMAPSGGVWPMMERGSFRGAAVEQAAFAQKVGQVSKVIETELGFYIVRTIDHSPGRERTFEDAQAEINQKLRRQQYDKLRQEYLEEIQRKMTVSLAEEFERVAVDAAVRRFYAPR